MRRRTLAWALVAAVASSGCLAGGQLTGLPSPEFEFVSSDGVRVNETTYLGKFVILDLMATWCGPCKLEVAHLREVQRIFGDEVVILSIGADPTETMADLEAFGEEYGASWPYALDRDGKIKQTFGMRIIPKLVILDPDGVVVFEQQGEVGVAAISRVIDPTAAPSPFIPIGMLGVGLAAGFLGPFNPYRKVHRDGPGRAASLAAVGVLAALALLAWPFSGIVSTRATYGSLFVGALSLVAVLWWSRAKRKVKDEPPAGSLFQQTSDRAYELGPAFAAGLAIALSSPGALGFFAPLVGVLGGALAGFAARGRIDARHHDALGLFGLVAVGVGLVAFGWRILAVEL